MQPPDVSVNIISTAADDYCHCLSWSCWSYSGLGRLVSVAKITWERRSFAFFLIGFVRLKCRKINIHHLITFCWSSSLPNLESFSENLSKFLSLSFWTVSIILSHFRAFSVLVFSTSDSSDNLSARSEILARRSSIVSFCSSIVSFKSLSSSAWSSMMFWRLSIGSSPLFQNGPGLVSMSPEQDWN